MLFRPHAPLYAAWGVMQRGYGHNAALSIAYTTSFGCYLERLHDVPSLEGYGHILSTEY